MLHRLFLLTHGRECIYHASQHGHHTYWISSNCYLYPMKGKKTLFIRLLVAMLLIATLAYSFYAFFVSDTSFLSGFCLSLLSVLLSIALLRVLKRSSIFSQASSHWHLLFGLSLLSWLILSLLFLRQNDMLKQELQQQNLKQKQQLVLIEAARKSNLGSLMNNVLNQVDEELKNNPQRTLSASTISRICALSHSLQAYPYLEGDSLSTQTYSPERGQLLTALCLLQLNPETFKQIKDNTSFAAADLRGTDLNGADLSGVNLQGADLSQAILKDANLSSADLKGAKFSSTNLQGADLNSADLKRADFSWANLNQANLQDAALNGVYMLNTQLRKANLRNTYIQWADLSGSIFDEADMRCVDLKGSNLEKASLYKTNLQDAYLGRANFNETNLKGAILLDVNMTGYSPVYLKEARVLEENWLDLLVIWRVKGAAEIKERYRLVEDLPEANNFYLEDR